MNSPGLRLKKSLTFLLLLLSPVVSGALNFVPGAEESKWQVAGDQLECRLAQSIPVFGEAVFARRAGERATFYLQSYDRPATAEPVKLIAAAPAWKPLTPVVAIGTIETSATMTPVQINSPLSDRMLAYLQEGMFPVFSNWRWYPEEEPVDVGVSAVNFMPAYREYQQCLSGLLDLDFNELSESQIMFDTAEYDLSPASRQRLRAVAQLIKADSAIKQCHIAGYTDDVGASRYNMDLSRKRAEAVELYLVQLGVDPALVKTTFHGEANWVSSSTDEKSRAQNRRVTLRLERTE